MQLTKQDIQFLQDQFVDKYVNHTYVGMDHKEVHTRIWFDVVEELLSSKGLISTDKKSDKTDSSIS